jgi:hypothetical protein
MPSSHTPGDSPICLAKSNVDENRGEGEVLFTDIQDGTAHLKKSFEKVKKCCELAAQTYCYVWIDTCCIDKSSSSELSEAINSMFSYYEKSKICYVYLEIDVPSGIMSTEDFRKARWTYRGWYVTLLRANTKSADCIPGCTGHCKN